MKVIMLTKYSPIRGRMLQAGQVIDVPDEVALDLVQRGLAQALKRGPERATGPGQGKAD
mgnify:CR=1 FL=1